MEKGIAIAVFAGSLRKDSYSKKLARQAAGMAESLGASASFIDLKDYPLPVYDEDLRIDGRLVANARVLKNLFYNADAFIICTPEYNNSYPAALKNMIEWVSRKDGSDDPNNCFDDKPVLTLSSSPGIYGGARALLLLRILLTHMKMLLLPEQLSLSSADSAFDDQGNLKDEKKRAQLEGHVKKLLLMAGKLKK